MERKKENKKERKEGRKEGRKKGRKKERKKQRKKEREGERERSKIEDKEWWDNVILYLIIIEQNTQNDIPTCNIKQYKYMILFNII